MASAAKSIEKAYQRVQRYRSPQALQRLLEEQLFLLSQRPHLQEGQEGYVEGENPPNPLYAKMATKERMTMKLSIAKDMRAHLPSREAEQRIDELEGQLGEIRQLLHANAPFLLPGNGGNRGGPLVH